MNSLHNSITVPNSIVHLPDFATSLISTDTDDIESCLEVKIKKNEPEQKTIKDTADMDFFPANVLVGLMASKHRNTPERPSVQIAKHKQRNNFISVVLACAVSKIKYNLSDNMELYIAVPPSETVNAVAEKEFQARLLGSYVVEFPKYMGGKTVAFSIDSIKVYAESFMAATSFFFDMSGRVQDHARGFLTGNILSLDIGASTTDMSIVQKGKFLDSSGRTFHYGGNTARENLSASISEIYGIDYPPEEVDRFMSEGRIQMGNVYEDASEIVNIAKQDLANIMMTEVENYFKSIKFPIQLLNAVVVSGGGSMQSQYVDENGSIVKTAEPMSYFVTQKLTNWSKGTVVVSYGEDARYANVKGLFIRAKMDELRRQQLAQANQAPVNNQAPVTPQPMASAQAAQPQVNQTPVEPGPVVSAQAAQPQSPILTQATSTQNNQPAQQ